MVGRRLWRLLLVPALALVGALPASAQEDAWRGEYFNNTTLRGRPAFIRYDPDIDFDWGGGGPGLGVGDDNFSVRWTRNVVFGATGTYEFGARTDDGVRVWVDGRRVIDEWGPRQGQWALGQILLTAGVHAVRMEYYEGEGGAQAHLGWRLAASDAAWSAEYYANENLSGGPALTREDERIAFEWGADRPDPAVPFDGFSARWRRSVYFYAGTYRFNTISDDGVRVFVDGQPVIDAWHVQARATYSVTLALESGFHALQVDYFDRAGEAVVHAWWEPVQITAPPESGGPSGGGGPWLGEYFSNRDLIGPPVITRNDAAVSFDWSDGPPHPTLPKDNFSARWTRTVNLSRGTWRFYANVDDGVRIWANDHSLIYQWIETESGVYQADLSLTEGGTFKLTVEYFEATGYARVKVWYEKIDDQPR